MGQTDNIKKLPPWQIGHGEIQTWVMVRKQIFWLLSHVCPYNHLARICVRWFLLVPRFHVFDCYCSVEMCPQLILIGTELVSQYASCYFCSNFMWSFETCWNCSVFFLRAVNSSIVLASDFKQNLRNLPKSLKCFLRLLIIL